MRPAGALGILFFILCGWAVVHSLVAQRIPARWPMPAIDADKNPFLFWFWWTGYLMGAVGGLALATKFLA
jgi:hypothetical protein